MLYLKALHIIFVVTWFAGLFYIVRLFVYQTEANEKGDPEKSILTSHLKVWSKRLWYGITWPSAVLATIFGLLMIEPWWGQQWMNIKLFLVLGLWIYHYIIHFKFKELQRDTYKYSGQKMRILNEVATIFLVAIVFLVTLKSLLSLAWGLGGLAIFIVLLMTAIRIYKNYREKNETSS
ncbi:MAG: CopD family protein [Cyclobacteriaceae bacterium]